MKNLALIVVAVVMDGLMVYFFYQWFIQSWIEAPDMPFVAACGIGSFLNFTNATYSDYIAILDKSNKPEVSVRAVEIFVWAMFMVIGYILHLLA